MKNGTRSVPIVLTWGVSAFLDGVITVLKTEALRLSSSRNALFSWEACPADKCEGKNCYFVLPATGNASTGGRNEEMPFWVATGFLKLSMP